VGKWGVFIRHETSDDDGDDVRRDTSGRRHSNLGVFETSYDAETPDVFFLSPLEHGQGDSDTLVRKDPTKGYSPREND